MERTPMENALSTDVVLDIIVSRLKVRDLLACRKVSKFWNKAASSVLRRRSTMVKNISKDNQLMELEECMEQSSDFPFTGLRLDKPWNLRTARAMEFFNNYGARFRSLRLDTHLTIRLEDLAPLIHHLPRLSFLELGSRWSEPPNFKVSEPADSKILDLSSVRTIRIWLRYPHQVNEDVLCQVLRAASSSELRIECLAANHEILRILRDVGKLQAISVMRVDERWNETALRMNELRSTGTPALTKLIFENDQCTSRNGLMGLLMSSQHTLKELCVIEISPSEFLPECPVLPKLSELTVCIFKDYKYIFKGREGHKFPALKELTLSVSSTFNLSDGLFIVPSLKKIDLLSKVGKAGIGELARSFPNVIKIRLKALEASRHSDLSDIWSVERFKFLEKLVIWDYTDKPKTKNYMNMDRFLTGIPLTICENLRKQPQQNLMGSPFNEILRDSPNLLQLKNLKALTVCVSVRLKNKMDQLPEKPPFISMVSVWYALQMMPNLQAKFVYKPWDFVCEKRDKAELKAAFKHVQPYVELEPFFY